MEGRSVGIWNANAARASDAGDVQAKLHMLCDEVLQPASREETIDIIRQLRGVRRLIVAGGETSGAVVGALAPKALFIGPEIDPGVPWTLTLGEAEPMALALKSGNFGAPDFFLKAWDVLS